MSAFEPDMVEKRQIGCTFGDFELLRESRMLRKGNEEIKLARIQFEVLLLLVEKAGEVVPKEKLQQALWPNTFVGPNSLSTAVSRLRQTLGKSAIENVSRVGYRFVIPASPLFETPVTASPSPAPASPSTDELPNAASPPPTFPAPPAVSLHHRRAWRLSAAIILASCCVALTISIPALLRAPVVASPAQPSSAPDRDLAARDHLVRAHHFIDQKDFPGSQAALLETEEAIRLKPGYAEAWAALAEIYINLPLGIPAPLAYEKAKVAAMQALAYDPNLCQAHRDLAYVLAWNERDWRGAEREFNVAIRLDPNDMRAHGWYASFLEGRGRPMEALPHARRCLELDPLSIGARFGYGAALIQAGQLDQAVKYLLVLARQEPQNEVAYGFLGIAYNRLGQHRLASQMYEKAFQCSGFKNAGYEAGIAWSRALDGDKAYARLCYRKLTAQRRGGAPVPAYQLALLAITLNRLHDALDWFEAAAKDRSLSFFELATEPLLNSLNAEPRFQTVRSQFQ